MLSIVLITWCVRGCHCPPVMNDWNHILLSASWNGAGNPKDWVPAVGAALFALTGGTGMKPSNT